jgi:hypothetical protein
LLLWPSCRRVHAYNEVQQSSQQRQKLYPAPFMIHILSYKPATVAVVVHFYQDTIAAYSLFIYAHSNGIFAVIAINIFTTHQS